MSLENMQSIISEKPLCLYIMIHGGAQFHKIITLASKFEYHYSPTSQGKKVYFLGNFNSIVPLLPSPHCISIKIIKMLLT